MKEIPLIGCLRDCKVISAAADRLILEGPIFTADKINKNGWGIPLSESTDFAASLTGQPLRYCPAGQPMLGIPGAHQCDALDDETSKVGIIERVYPAGKDEQGRVVYNQRVIVTDHNVIKGIMDGSIPARWSVFGVARHIDKDGMVYGVIGKASSLVDEPAYDEAVFRWRKIAASNQAADPFFTLIMPGDDIHKNFGGPKLADEQKLQEIRQEDTKSKEPNTEKSVLAEVKVPATSESVLSREEVEKMIAKAKEEASRETRDMLIREGLVKDITALQVAAGVLDPADVEATSKDLMTLSAAMLASEKAKYAKIVEKLQKPSEKPLAASKIQAHTAKIDAPKGLEEYLGKFIVGGKPLTIEDYAKYGTSNVRRTV